ncbi:MAG: polysaccharide biosynthesis protein [Chelatococcus sp.]|uniref:nucleoside-diphosphate sugar epimerase/dehydratase n=1 Tax=Chelatococcus sp. TaxID=1953771 RepID=UPI0025B99157|nr:nucleoside-diphosphate sugar epimerase/dehydratase [Chelatococcus sp.]MBX3539993.1 polysaccharide biosynthesis protein [Chelatococcus sp.]
MARLDLIPSLKKTLIVIHDLVATALAVTLAFIIRFEGGRLATRLDLLPTILPVFLIYAGAIYWLFSLYKSKWRFASLPDLSNIVRASTVLALTLLVVDYVLASSTFYGFFFFGKITIALYWLLQVALLGGPRLAYRYIKYEQAKTHAKDGAHPALLLGRGTDIEALLRAIESGAFRKISAEGILSPRQGDLGQAIRGVPVLGSFADLEQVVAEAQERGVSIRRLVLTQNALTGEHGSDTEGSDLLLRARRLGLPLSRMQDVEEGMSAAALQPVEIEDLLLRPTVEIDRARLARFVRGRRIVVTGGGGSIGSELCLRSAAFGASDILVIENSEPALHQITEALANLGTETKVEGAIADVRDRMRMDTLFARFNPDIVFHAAALKHVPYLEQDWGEGIRTNVFGSVNVADAAVAAGAKAMVMISTDKAIEPVSMLGATKRFAEMYAQALDAEMAGADGGRGHQDGGTRLIAVRFGNVLGSNGSVVPKFKAQIARGGPVTVTHRDMVRYFMTVREAVDLVITAASHADGEGRVAGEVVADASTDNTAPREQASVYVLKMGQPVRIYALAERMIRLAGFEPGADIDIVETGIRPGERLHEILFSQQEPMAETGIDGVMAAKPLFADRRYLAARLAALAEAITSGDRLAAEAILEDAIPEFAARKTPPIKDAAVVGSAVPAQSRIA